MLVLDHSHVSGKCNSLRVQEILCEINCGNMQWGVDGKGTAKTLFVVDVWAHFIGEDALGLLQCSVGERDESYALQWCGAIL